MTSANISTERTEFCIQQNLVFVVYLEVLAVTPMKYLLTKFAYYSNVMANNDIAIGDSK